MEHNKEWAKLTRRRWFVLVASCLINLCIGSMYTWSVFSGPMAEHLNSKFGVKVELVHREQNIEQTFDRKE